MPNKKKQRNGFYFFMKDLQKEWNDQGRFVKMEKMPPEAHPLWVALPEEKKEAYNRRAKEHKNRVKETEEGKMDCFGLPITHSKKAQSEQAMKSASMERDIKNLMTTLGTLEAIANENFYVVSFANFCATDEKEYIPAEVGIVEFSIKNGITDQYHEFIHPSEIPPGYKFTCIDESEKTHGIPVENFELASADYRNIYDNLLRFVRSRTNSDDRHVYTMPDDMEATSKSFEWLCKKSRSSCTNAFVVYDLISLLVQLRQTAQDLTRQFVSIYRSNANDFLTMSTYDYVPNIGCAWHDSEDKARFCALGIAKRRCYLLADAVCERYKVDFIPGKHLPEDISDEKSVSVPSYSFKISGHTKKYNPPIRPKEMQENLAPGSSITKGKSVFAPPQRHFTSGAAIENDPYDTNLGTYHAQQNMKRSVNWDQSTGDHQTRNQSLEFSFKDEEFPDLGGAKPKQPVSTQWYKRK